MVKKINMKGGGNEVIILIAVLLICVLIGGAAIVLWPDDKCKEGTVATDKCKCEKEECKKGETCNDGACDADDGPASPGPPDATAAGGGGSGSSGSCSDTSLTTQPTCESGGGTWTPSPPPPPPQPPAVRHPCLDLHSSCEGPPNYVCKAAIEGVTGDRSRGYFKSGNDPELETYCQVCPEGSTNSTPGGGIESCLCDADGSYMSTTAPYACETCPNPYNVRHDDECVCNLGENYEGESDGCSRSTPVVESPIILDTVNVGDLDPSLHKALLFEYPSCALAVNLDDCNVDPEKRNRINNLIISDTSTGGFKNRIDDTPIANLTPVAGGTYKCPAGESLTKDGLTFTCQPNECLASSVHGINAELNDLNKFPGIGCIEATTLQSLFKYGGGVGQDELYIYDEGSSPVQVKDALIGLCPSGDTCALEAAGSCDELSRLVQPRGERELFDKSQNTCRCPVGMQQSVATGDGQMCFHDCVGTPCVNTTVGGIETTVDGVNAVRNDHCNCPCTNGFTLDDNGECTVEPATGRMPTHTNHVRNDDNLQGLCWNGSEKNTIWDSGEYDTFVSESGGIIKHINTQDPQQILTRSYKDPVNHKWVHECKDSHDNNLSNKFNPFTRFKCKINEYLNVTHADSVDPTDGRGSCNEIAASCAGKAMTDNFIGNHRRYDRECSFSNYKTITGDGHGKLRPETETDGLPPNNTNCCEPCASDSAGWNEKPWNSDDIFEPTTVNTANFYNPQYLQDNTPTSPLYSGIGYNTRPIGYDLDPSTTTPMESTLIGSYLGTGAHGTIEQVKQNLFVCKKTNFPGDHTSGWGHGDIGGTGVTEQEKTALDSTHGCVIDNDGDNCQTHYKYFDSTPRTAGLTERYLWMQQNQEYKFPNQPILDHAGCFDWNGGTGDCCQDHDCGKVQWDAVRSELLAAGGLAEGDISSRDPGDGCDHNTYASADPRGVTMAACWNNGAGATSNTDGGWETGNHKIITPWSKISKTGTKVPVQNCVARIMNIDYAYDNSGSCERIEARIKSE